MLALLHGVDHHRGMLFPVGGDIDQVDIITLAEFLPGFFTAAVGGGTGQAGLLEDALCLLHPVFVQVAQGHDLRSRDMGKTLYGARAAHAQADKADAYGVQLFGYQPQYVFLSRRASGYFCPDGLALLSFSFCPLRTVGTAEQENSCQ